MKREWFERFTIYESLFTTLALSDSRADWLAAPQHGSLKREIRLSEFVERRELA